MKPTKNLLPYGRYHCRLEARHAKSVPALEGGERSGLELHAVVTGGTHAGYPLKFHVWGEAKMQRARRLRRGELFVVAVTQFTLDFGMTVNRIVDFRAARELSVIEAVEGQGHGGGGVASRGDLRQESLPAETLVAYLRTVLNRMETEPGKSVVEGPPTPVTPPAFSAEYTTGFHRVGAKGGQRELVQHDDVLRQYTGCDPAVPLGLPGFLSLSQYSSDLASHVREQEGSLAGYRGRCWARWLAIDLDGDGTDATLDRILEDARMIVGVLLALGVPAASVVVFFSGRRGVHILWPSSVLAAGPKEGFEATVGVVCQAIASLVGVEIDMNIYKPLAALRAPNTPHEQTGLYKVLLPTDELAVWSAASCKAMAAAPRPFVMPDWSVAPLMPLHDLWRLACVVETTTRRRTAAVSTGERRIFGDTFDLMVHGAHEGSRGTRFFKAAMNLLDFDCPEPLLYALLEPAARLSGYPMNEFTAQIDGAITAHGNDPARNQT